MSIATGFAVAMAVAGSAAAGTTAANIYGAHKASSAADKAAKTQAESAHEALLYTEKKDAQDRADALAAQKANYEQWAAKERRMTPYRAAGQGASQTIASMLGLPAVDIPEPAPPPAFLSAPPAEPTTTTPTTTAMPSSRPRPGARTDPRSVVGSSEVGTMADLVPTPATVMMRSPSGQTKAVPQSQVEHFKALGAEVVA